MDRWIDEVLDVLMDGRVDEDGWSLVGLMYLYADG